MIRRSILSGSWYPSGKKEAAGFLDECTDVILYDPESVSGVVPHAGWVYSGRTAAAVAKTVCSGADLIVIAGGHLPPGTSILAAEEEAIQTPFGPVKNRIDILDELKKDLYIREDVYRDNTVEVVVPMASYFSDMSDLLWVRLPADETALAFAAVLHKVSVQKRIKVKVLGSTDLTHYGPNYSYEPAGRGKAGLDWVKNQNDAEIIRMLAGMKFKDALAHAERMRSACSSGAAAAAAKYAELSGKEKGRLLEYSTSYDVQPSDSFVGYAGIVY